MEKKLLLLLPLWLHYINRQAHKTYCCSSNQNNENNWPTNTIFWNKRCVGGDAPSSSFDVGCAGRMPGKLPSAGDAVRYAKRIGFQSWPKPRLKAARSEVSLALQKRLCFSLSKPRQSTFASVCKLCSTQHCFKLDKCVTFNTVE